MIMGCAANSDYFAHNDPGYGRNIQRYHELIRENDLCLTHTLLAPQVNRAVHPDQQAGGAVALHVVDETDSGLFLSGARILATLAPASDELFVAPAPSRSYAGTGNPRAFAFAIPVASPGLKFICRESFDIGRSSFDHPLGSRFEEMDCTAVFHRVLVPWERVFLYGDQEYCAALFRDTNAFNHAIHQCLTRNWVKAEFVLGVATLVAEAIGIADALHVLVEILQILGSSGLANIPSQVSVDSPDLADDIEQFYQGATLGGPERIRLFRLAWDIACSSFGGRQVLYERYLAGDFYRNVAVHYANHDKTPYKRLVEALLTREPAPTFLQAALQKLGPTPAAPKRP